MEVDRESVKTLAIAIGVRKAARRLGLNEDRVLQWSKRGNWLKPTAQPPKQGDVITVISPSQALAETLNDHETETRLSLARSTRRLAKDSEEATLRDADKVYTVAKTAGIVHGWGNDKAQAGFSLNVLNLGQLQIGVRNEQGEEPSA